MTVIAWTSPPTVVTGEVLTAAWGNTNIRDQFLWLAGTTGNISVPAVGASGLTGATAASRHAGGTASGAPASGDFLKGDFVIAQTGKVYICTVAGTPGTWIRTDTGKVYRIGHTYAISGEIKVPSGDTDFINPFFVSLATGQTAKLVKARYKINSGTSATVKLTKNGVDATGFTAISVTTTAAETDPADIDLADNDLLALVVTAVSGTPTNMTFTLFIEYTQ